MDITCDSSTPRINGGASLSARPTASPTSDVHKPHHLFRRIPLTQGKYAIVDEEDYARLNKYKWCLNPYYPIRGEMIDGKSCSILMHRQIIDCPVGFEVDHINGNKLDNRKINLRICTRPQNQWNSTRRKDNTSGYKGVNWDKRSRKWNVQIKREGKLIYVGQFFCLIKAGKAYDAAALKYHGEFAKGNFQTN